jgi:hypothetical protein
MFETAGVACVSAEDKDGRRRARKRANWASNISLVLVIAEKSHGTKEVWQVRERSRGRARIDGGFQLPVGILCRQLRIVF